jgi:hypothetical protein
MGAVLRLLRKICDRLDSSRLSAGRIATTKQAPALGLYCFVNASNHLLIVANVSLSVDRILARSLARQS